MKNPNPTVIEEVLHADTPAKRQRLILKYRDVAKNEESDQLQEWAVSRDLVISYAKERRMDIMDMPFHYIPNHLNPEHNNIAATILAATASVLGWWEQGPRSYIVPELWTKEQQLAMMERAYAALSERYPYIMDGWREIVSEKLEEGYQNGHCLITSVNGWIDALSQRVNNQYIQIDADAIMSIAYEKYQNLDTDELRERYWMGTPPAPDDAEAAEPDQDPA